MIFLTQGGPELRLSASGSWLFFLVQAVVSNQSLVVRKFKSIVQGEKWNEKKTCSSK